MALADTRIGDAPLQRIAVFPLLARVDSTRASVRGWLRLFRGNCDFRCGGRRSTRATTPTRARSGRSRAIGQDLRVVCNHARLDRCLRIAGLRMKCSVPEGVARYAQPPPLGAWGRRGGLPLAGERSSIFYELKATHSTTFYRGMSTI